MKKRKKSCKFGKFNNDCCVAVFVWSVQNKKDCKGDREKQNEMKIPE